MDVNALLGAGDLDGALARLVAEVKARPADGRPRAALFEALLFAGELTRAEKQLDALGVHDPEGGTALGIQLYRGLIAAERRRTEVFAGKAAPRFPLEPPAHVRLHVEAIGKLAAGAAAEARGLLDQAAEVRPPVPGVLPDDSTLDDVRDADDLLAPVLEVLTAAGYFWVPFEHLQFVEVAPPKALRDLFWAPAHLATLDGQLGEVFLPVLYPGSHAADDGLVRLGRRTDWAEAPGGLVRGAGAKLLLLGDDARIVPDLGALRLRPPMTDAASSTPDPAS